MPVHVLLAIKCNIDGHEGCINAMPFSVGLSVAMVAVF